MRDRRRDDAGVGAQIRIFSTARRPPTTIFALVPSKSAGPVARTKAPRAKRHRRGWKFYAAVGIGVPLLLASVTGAYYYVVFKRMIDARLSGDMQRTDPRVFGRPFEIRRGQWLTPAQLVNRLNDLGYAHRARSSEPGEFTVGRDAIIVIPRIGERKGEITRVVFAGRRTRTAEPTTIDHIELLSSKSKETTNRLTLDAPLITALVTSAREKRRDTPLSAIPQRMIQAVLAIEDRRFYDHVGIDPIGIAGAMFRNVFGSKQYLAGGSTLTQQLVKNTFLTPEKTPKRKMTEWFMSIALERRLSKDQILQLYLNDVSLGQRGSFAIHGVPEAARLFFAKDVSNLSLSEAATIAGVIQSPSRHSPFNNPDRARERRNVVLRSMVDAGYISADAAHGLRGNRSASWPARWMPRRRISSTT